jgi:hypothetical protein
MSFSITEIFNLALGRIGASVTMDAFGNDKNARACANAFELVVKEVSRSGEWNCLKKRGELARLGTAPIFGWSYAYQLPVDCLAVVQLNGWDGYQEDVFDIEGTKLLTNATEAKVQYVTYISDPTKWDSLFTSAVVALLASRVAITLRQDEGLSGALMQEYERIISPKAMTKNFNERKRARFNPVAGSSFITSRYFSTKG